MAVICVFYYSFGHCKGVCGTEERWTVGGKQDTDYLVQESMQKVTFFGIGALNSATVEQ